MQAGTLNDNYMPPPFSGYNPHQFSKMFWEVVGPNSQNTVSPQYVFTYDNGTSGGYYGIVDGGVPDYVQAYVAYYQPSDKGEFIVADKTAGFDLSTGYFHQGALPQPMGYYYYDGSTADFVTEREQGGAPQQPLREPFLETTGFLYAYANGGPIDPATYPNWTQITEVTTDNHRTLQTSDFSGTQDWSDTYKDCD